MKGKQLRWVAMTLFPKSSLRSIAFPDIAKEALGGVGLSVFPPSLPPPPQPDKVAINIMAKGVFFIVSFPFIIGMR
ncbi:hypothetical protein BJP24_20685 [Aeromonas allosaccharophila]|nr:hypothetical protein BJP24_20685 [Aeromonas allosaccharophila]